MAVPSSTLSEVKKWLNLQHIEVPLDWVEACIEFLHQEYKIPCESGSLQRLKSCIYEQWLAADLQEIGVQCLPPNLSVAQKTTLQGCYTLQVNGVCDIGKSAYSQLKLHDGTSNANSEVSACPKPFVPEWEAKPTRMLMMNLTDGINCIQGMEYKPISFISVDLPVGVKVLIQGPVDCRFGVLLLTAEKIRVLGGEVEVLIEKYSKQEVLREALQLKNENEVVAVENGHPENRNSAGMNRNNAVQNARSAPVQQHNHSQISSDISSHSAIPDYLTNRQSQPQNYSGSGVAAENLDFDNFEDYDDDDAFIKSIDYSALEQMEKESIPSVVPEKEDFQVSEVEVYRDVRAFQEDATVDISKCEGTSPGQHKFSLPVATELTSSAQNMSPSVKLPGSPTPVFSFPVNQRAPFLSSTSISTNNPALSTSSVKSSVNPSGLSISSTSSFNPYTSPKGHAEVKPCSYISSVLKDLDPSSEFTVTIKARISAALSRLECYSTLGWQLTAKLSDETGTFEATIHDKVLEEFVGISAKDMVALQRKARNNLEIRNHVIEAISKCKNKMQNLNCLMEVKFAPQLAKPCVIKCFP